MAVTVLTARTQAASINYSYSTSGTSDWSSIPNSTYFYDLVDKLPHYKNSGGTVLEMFSNSSGAGLTYFSDTGITASPNASVPVVALIATSGATNLDVAIVPKGTGSFMLNIPDSTLVGGDKRGTEAIDLQISRNASTQVASGQRSTLLGGWNSIASGSYSLANGLTNSATNNYSVALGDNNTASGQWSLAVGYSNISNNNGSVALGYDNNATNAAAVALGDSNTASGSRDVSLGRQNNASGGDSIAIGTLNTNSGYGSQALGFSLSVTGVYATALGNGSTVGGLRALSFGYANTANGESCVNIGNVNTTSAQASRAFGQSNTASGIHSTAIGSSNTASGQYSLAYGFVSSTFGIYGRQSYSSGQESTIGDSQISKFILRERTTGSTATTLTTDSGAASTANQVILSNQSAYGFTGTIVGKQSGTTSAAMWKVEGLIVRGSSATATTLTTSTITTISNAPGWGTPTLSADTTNGGLQVQVIGSASTNIQWTSAIETTEVIYA